MSYKQKAAICFAFAVITILIAFCLKAESAQIIIYTDTDVAHYYSVDDDTPSDEVFIIINQERVNYEDLKNMEINSFPESFPDGRTIYRTSEEDFHLKDEGW